MICKKCKGQMNVVKNGKNLMTCDNHHRCEYVVNKNKQYEPGMVYTVFDLEFAKSEKYNETRLIQVTLDTYRDEKKLSTYDTNVRFEEELPNVVKALTKIEEVDLIDAPSELEVVNKIYKIFKNSTFVVGHNIINCDLNILFEKFHKYDLNQINWQDQLYFDTGQSITKTKDQISLVNQAQKFEIILDEVKHHTSIEDTRVCAMIFHEYVNRQIALEKKVELSHSKHFNSHKKYKNKLIEIDEMKLEKSFENYYLYHVQHSHEYSKLSEYEIIRKYLRNVTVPVKIYQWDKNELFNFFENIIEKVKQNNKRYSVTTKISKSKKKSMNCEKIKREIITLCRKDNIDFYFINYVQNKIQLNFIKDKIKKGVWKSKVDKKSLTR